ncbi:MAG TPA: patatin-like phospholipase family protein [Polyangiaceae bacterium]
MTVVGLVLAGGAARGAYEVGVVRYVLEDVAKAIGRDVPIDVLCGTSAGSINACLLAAHADKPSQRGAMLARKWTGLKLDDVVRPSGPELLHLAGRLIGRSRSAPHDARAGRRGGIFDPSGVESIVRDAVPFERIADHIREGRLSALSISTTHVASGRTIVFVQRTGGGVPRWGGDPTMVGRAAEIRSEHVLASAAVPLLFPAVEIDGQFYCDGGLRQNVPLSPARRLGADSLIVVNPRFIRDVQPSPALAEAREREYPDPLFVLGKAMNALLLDRIENDIDRLVRLNAVLYAGTKHWGPTFATELNAELGQLGVGALRPLEVVYVRASRDIGVMAAEFARSPAFAKRVRGLMGRALRRIAEGESEADLLSYVLFDGDFCGQLIEMGRADARAKHDELVSLFERRLSARPPARV